MQPSMRVAPPTGNAPVTGPFTDFRPSDYFGAPVPPETRWGPFVRRNLSDQIGSGLYGLPEAFMGWQSASRYAFAPSLQYAGDMAPVLEQQRRDAGRDWAGDLYAASSDVAEAQFSDTRRRREQALARAGYGGGGTISPFQAEQLQLEGQARAGVLGSAARESVLQAQSARAEASRNYLNSLSQRYQALLAPAMLQSAGVTRTSTGPVGPSNLIGPSFNLAASAIGALS